MKTITIKGKKYSAQAIRRAPQTPATGGHSIATLPCGDVHWMPWGDDETHVFNAGGVRRKAPFGAKIAFLTHKP